MEIFKHEISYSQRLTPSCAVDTMAYVVNLDLDFVDFLPGGLLFRIARFDALPVKETDTTPDDLVAVLVDVEAAAEVPNVERLNVIGSAAIFAFWATLEASCWGRDARKRGATPFNVIR